MQAVSKTSKIVSYVSKSAPLSIHDDFYMSLLYFISLSSGYVIQLHKKFILMTCKITEMLYYLAVGANFCKHEC